MAIERTDVRRPKHRWLGRLGAFALPRIQRHLLHLAPERAERVGEFLGKLHFKLDSKHRRRALSNLALAFPQMPEAERHELARKVFVHFGQVMADFLTAPGRGVEKILATTEIVGLEHLDAALAAGKGALLTTGHLGNWERLRLLVSVKGYPLSVVVRDADDPGINSVMRDVRGEAGTGVIPRGNAARKVLECLRRNEIVAILTDQNASDHFVEFFGKPTGTVLSLGVFHQRTGAALIPGYCVRTGPARYKLVFEPPLEVPQPIGPRGEAVVQAAHTWLEHQIRRFPEQWLWYHDRWKSARRRRLL